MRTKLAWVVGFTIVCVVAAFVVPPVPQPLSYHHFADEREMLGVPRFLDVASNVAFLVAGVLGLAIVAWRRAAFELPQERWPYVVCFAGLIATSAGSGYYHLLPDNARLVWDRLPIMITLAGLLLSQVGDRISVRAANALLIPAVIIGGAAAWYWHVTDNLVPYLVAQLYAATMAFVIALAFPSRYSLGGYIYWAFAWFVASKIFETYDEPIYHALHVVSGHTLKHLAAAAAGFVLCGMLGRRRLVRERRGL